MDGLWPLALVLVKRKGESTGAGAGKKALSAGAPCREGGWLGFLDETWLNGLKESEYAMLFRASVGECMEPLSVKMDRLFVLSSEGRGKWPKVVLMPLASMVPK